MSNTQIQLSNTRVKVLSIPRKDYWLFSSGILKLLNQSVITDTASWSGSGSEYGSDYDSDTGVDRFSLQQPLLSSNLVSSINDLRLMDSSENEYASGQLADSDDLEEFFHIAFTANECTIIFSEVFLPFFEQLLAVAATLNKNVKLLSDLFYLLEIAGDGLNIGKRVVQITEPLSKADISLFFLSNYFSDIVLVPSSARDKVVSLLEGNNFQFSNHFKSYNSVGELNSDSRLPETQSRAAARDGASLDPATTFEAEPEEDIFVKYHDIIKPKVSLTSKLLLTGLRSNDSRLIIEKTILSLSCNSPEDTSSFPKIFSITKTLQDEVALLVPKNYGKFFTFSSRNLVGSIDEVMVPITIDLFELPIDSKGIVSGVAKKLIKHFDKLGKGQDCELSYLSMARSAIVMIPIENLDDIRDVIKW